MEIKITTNQILKVLQVLSWLIFIGLCIQAGALIVNTFITLFINPDGVKNIWEGADYLTSLYNFDQSHFITVTIIMIIVAVLKAIMFYLIIKLFVDKKLNITSPFSIELKRFIQNTAYLTLGIGLFAHGGFEFTYWLTEQGIATINLQSLGLAGADVWLFMAVVLIVIAQIVRRGIEIQDEHSLTV